ncbi:hypothetical protein L9F63_018115, partial [Diploptera punctata]
STSGTGVGGGCSGTSRVLWSCVGRGVVVVSCRTRFSGCGVCIIGRISGMVLGGGSCSGSGINYVQVYRCCIVCTGSGSPCCAGGGGFCSGSGIRDWCWS